MHPLPVTSIAVAGVATLALATLLAGWLARRGFPLPEPSNRAGCIDGLRGYLALFVLIGHAMIWINLARGDGTWTGIALYPFGGLGGGAVPAFFMITGFLFYPRIQRGIDGNDWVGFVVTRAFRILPLVIFSFVVISLVIGLRHGIPAGYPRQEYLQAAARWVFSIEESPIFRHADSGQVNAYVLWSLWYEWMFYLLLVPGLALAMSLKPTRIPTVCVPMALLALSLAARFVIHRPVVLFVPLFAIGMLAYEVQARPGLRGWLRSTPASFVAAGCLLVSAALPRQGVPLANMLLDGVFFMAIASGNSLWGILRWKGALVLGECSFGIYLLHGIFLSVFFGGTLADLLPTPVLPFALPILAGAVVIFSAGTYQELERPLIATGARLAKWLTGRAPRLNPIQLDVAP